MYTYKYGGQDGTTYQLVEAKDLVVIRTEKEVELRDMTMSKTARSLLSGLIPVAAFPEANVMVYRCVSMRETTTPENLRNNIRRKLNQEEGIRFAGRVLKDVKTGTIFVYTENFFLKFKDDIKQERCEAIIKKMGLTIKEALPFAKNAYFLCADEGTGLKIFDIANSCLEMGEVEYCHPELVRPIKHKAVHPMQWHLIPSQINGQTINQHVNIEEAWTITRGAGTVIAVIDDGVDAEHEEFSAPGKVVAPRDTILNINDAGPKRSTEMHGTACAGVACANGSHKASGVAPEAKLMPIRFGGLGSMAEAKAFAWAADNGADVISCSWGPADGDWWNPSDPLHFSRFDLPDSSRLAINYAINSGRDGKGCVIVWAGGNGNENIGFDGYASYDKVIAVAACNDRGTRSVYSDFGKAIWCSFPSSDFFVPQLNHPRPLSPGIWTTDRSGNQGYNDGGLNAESTFGDFEGHYTATFGGTSSACPGVAGVVALMLSVNPELTWREIKAIIKNSCDRIDEDFGNYDANGHSPFYGFGRINAGKAVQNAQATLQPMLVPNVTGIVHFKKPELFNLSDDEWIAASIPDDRLLGIQLQVDPFLPDLGIRYQVVLNNLGPTSIAENGTFCGTDDRRRKLIGFRAELTGSLAADYTVEYSGRFGNEDEIISARNGAFCGKGSGRGEALEAVKIKIVKRSS